MSEPKAYTLVTGASGGIGEAFARALAAQGRSLVLVARSENKLQQLGRELADQHRIDARVLVADLSEAGQPERIVEWCRQQGLAVDLVINNAGVGLLKAFADSSAEELEKMLQLNVVTATLIALRFAQEMQARGVHGTILNVASTAAFQPMPFMAVYAASKAYLLSLTQAADHELRPLGIRMLALCPGPTRTEFFSRSGVDDSATNFVFQKPEQVVRVGLRAIETGKTVSVSGWLNRIIALGGRLGPSAISLRIAKYLTGH